MESVRQGRTQREKDSTSLIGKNIALLQVEFYLIQLVVDALPKKFFSFFWQEV